MRNTNCVGPKNNKRKKSTVLLKPKNCPYFIRSGPCFGFFTKGERNENLAILPLIQIQPLICAINLIDRGAFLLEMVPGLLAREYFNML